MEMGGTLRDLELRPLTNVTSLALGSGHSCALDGAGLVKCWGRNDQGQLGTGDTQNRGDDPMEVGEVLPAIPLDGPAIQLAAGESHTCALIAEGRVKCWGGNAFGQLGSGDTAPRGAQPGDIDTLADVDLGQGARPMSLFAGSRHTCALLDTGAIKCWGDGSLGQLGNETPNRRGDEPGEMGEALPEVDLGLGPTQRVRSGAAGGSHNCALIADGDACCTLKCWGFNAGGQLGLGDTQSRGLAAGQMGTNLPTVPLPEGQLVTDLALGGTHTCAKLSSQDWICWGQNNYGQLGVGDTQSRGDAPGELGALRGLAARPGTSFSRLFAGSGHTCALDTDNGVTCWGDNAAGQLGVGDANARGDDATESPDQLPLTALR